MTRYPNTLAETRKENALVSQHLQSQCSNSALPTASFPLGYTVLVKHGLTNAFTNTFGNPSFTDISSGYSNSEACTHQRIHCRYSNQPTNQCLTRMEVLLVKHGLTNTFRRVKFISEPGQWCHLLMSINAMLYCNTHTHTHNHTHTHTHTTTQTHTHTTTQTHTHNHTNTHTHNHTDTHTQPHRHTHNPHRHTHTHTLLQSNRCRSIACRLSEVKVISGWLIYRRCSFCTGLTSCTWQGKMNSESFFTYSALIPVYCYPVLYTTNGLNAFTGMSYIVCTQLCSFHYTTFTKNNTDTQRPIVTKIS